MKLTTHQRDNFERTDDKLHEIRGLVYAFDFLHDACRNPEIQSNEELAKDIVLRLLVERVGQINYFRRMEWVGQGGETPFLTPHEIAAARGETPKQ